MVYEEFLSAIKENLHASLGEGYHVIIQKIPKNNGTLLDALCISKHSDRVTPTIYLNSYYERLTSGGTMEEILNEILEVYTDSSLYPQIDPEMLSDFNALRRKVAYKLIHTASNQQLLKTVPHIPFLDLSIVFYLFLEESQYGHMTALIHQEHLAAWNTNLDELYQLATENTPRLLTADIKNMDELMTELAKAQLGEDYMDEFMEELFIPEDAPPLFVLSNAAGLNGACVILYENLLKNFADSLGQDLIILPSSIHEVLLIPYTEDMIFQELYDMVCHINLTEVPVEDRLSNQIYYFNRQKNQTTLIPVLSKYPAS